MALAAVRRGDPSVLDAAPRAAAGDGRGALARSPDDRARGGRRAAECGRSTASRYRPASARPTGVSTLRAAWPTPSFHVQLEYELPREIAVGAGTALFVCGWCFSPAARIRSLSLRARRRGPAGGRCAHAAARSVPSAAPGSRPVRHRGRWATIRTPSPIPSCSSYRSGFWGIGRDRAARAAAADGRWRCAPSWPTAGRGRPRLATIGRRRRPAPQPAALAGGARAGRAVAIAMATYNPPPTCSSASSSRSAPRRTATGSA